MAHKKGLGSSRNGRDSQAQRLGVLLLALAGLTGSPSHQSQGDEFRWHGPVAAGKTIEIVGVNGSIDASGA